MRDGQFTLRRGGSALILSIPHAGGKLIPGLEARLTPVGRALIDTDWWLERLYAFAADLDATILRAELSRTVVDLNRDPDGASLYPGQATTSLVPTATFDGEPLYRAGEAPSDAEIAERRERYFWPYHRALEAEIARVRNQHGIVALHDCHSIRSVVPRLFDGRLPVFNLGTNSGASCAPELEARLAGILAGSGSSWVVNGRFKGGWITRHHGRPAERVHVAQMELACRAYMRETPPFDYDEAAAAATQVVLRRVLETMLEWAGGERSR